MDNDGLDEVGSDQPRAEGYPRKLPAITRRITRACRNLEHDKLSRLELQKRGSGLASPCTQDEKRPALRSRRGRHYRHVVSALLCDRVGREVERVSERLRPRFGSVSLCSVDRSGARQTCFLLRHTSSGTRHEYWMWRLSVATTAALTLHVPINTSSSPPTTSAQQREG